MSDGRHRLPLDDLEVTVLQQALLAFATVLKIQTGPTTAPELQRLADLTARISSRVQRHTGGLCDCPTPPVLGGTHT